MGEATGIAVHRSKRFVFIVSTRRGSYKVFQVGFLKTDGSLFVAFPYYIRTEGILSSLATHPAGAASEISIDLGRSGKATSHLVKYSHHPDGEALFSQDGKVISAIRRRSVPLATAEGHLFTIQLQGLGDFERVDPDRDQHTITPKRAVLQFEFPTSEPEAVKFVGWWYSAPSLTARQPGDPIGPVASLMKGDGSVVRGFLVGSLAGWPLDQHVLALTCEAIPRLDPNEPSCLTFIGGFDPPEIASDQARDTTFLAMIYPAADPAGLAARVGTIDLPKPLGIERPPSQPS